MSVDGFGNLINKKNRNKDNNNMNNLLLKNSSNNEKKGILKKSNNKNYKDISNYKPTGNFIYNTKLIKSIEDVTDNKK